jgi:hypothetical protein
MTLLFSVLQKWSFLRCQDFKMKIFSGSLGREIKWRPDSVYADAGGGKINLSFK